MDATRARFLAAISERLGADRIVELHLFSPIRQGVMETGVAVVGAVEKGEEAECGAGAQAGESLGEAVDASSADAVTDALSNPSIPERTVPVPVSVSEDGSSRLVVFTATYRLTRKGPDRGKWEFDVAATADAPLATVDVVARGVTQRSKDLTETERFSGEQLRALLQDPQWRTPT